MKYDNNFLFSRKKQRSTAIRYKPPEQDRVEYVRDQITDSDGLQRAYQRGDTYVHGNTMYIAGSHTAKDWFDDFTKVPAWGDLRDSTRYQRANDTLHYNPHVTTVVGHSLGGSVALELQKNHKNIKKSRTYGAPVFDILGSESKGVDRYRNWLDPVSVLDRSAKKSFKENPFESASLTHDYSNIAKNFTSTDYIRAPTRNSNGALSLF